jgi:hypothetical protein
MAKRKRITGNLTPKLALDELGPLRDLATFCRQSSAVSLTHTLTAERLERLLLSHVRAAVEREARK